MAQESHPQCYLLLLNLLTKNDLRLFSWNQDNTHTHTHSRPQTDTHSSLLLPSQLDHDNPLHPGNMSSLIRLVSAALEKPPAPCGEGPTREASAATRQTGPAGPEAEGKGSETTPGWKPQHVRASLGDIFSQITYFGWQTFANDKNK